MTQQPGRYGRLSAAQQQEREEFIAARNAAVAEGDTRPLREWLAKVEAREEARHRLLVDRASNRPAGAPRQPPSSAPPAG
ncbi:hypothetical protein [Tenggerimyces flavus]|uniref:Uncharacterized protein n=1 Tax=Tenggerimyces flavus TaxID=1708749 RepID=A0ABV7YC60_9ACTN|nr:hypothetical protein [Tenggerimyces flavus]MBM7783661.1 hypothetical protein [Tenggerimyces flavus]